MISIRAGRKRSQDRKQTETDKSVAGQVKTYLAPIEGLVTAAPKPAGRGAVVLENFWPTPTGIEPRGGLSSIGDAGSRIYTLFEYRAGNEKFAATATAVYSFTDTALGVAETLPAAPTSGEWSTYEVQNAGGSFLLCVNGTDDAMKYDGAAWTASTITGIDTSFLSHVWGYRNRVFFTQKGTLSAWYLGTNSIDGAATEIPLSATFNNGGSLIAGATWSSDSGDGMDDRCVFITDAGEIAVFSGSDPADINNWSLDGVYEVGKILGPKAVLRISGDLLFATDAGLIPLSGAVQKDPLELSSASLAAKIEPDWQGLALEYPLSWRLMRWEKGGMMAAVPIGAETQFSANMTTNAWMKLAGWICSDLRGLSDGLYLADMDGALFRAWIGGSDNGNPIRCRAMFAHDALGAPANIKTAQMARPVWRHTKDFMQTVSVRADYGENFPPVSVTLFGEEGEEGSLWDVSDWDTTFWASEGITYSIRKQWETVSGVGQALGVQVQVASNSSARMQVQLQRVDLMYSIGGIDL